MEGAGCLSGIVCVASGGVAAAAHVYEWPAPVFWIAAVACGLSLVVTLIAFGAFGEFLIDLLEAIFSGFGHH